MQAEEYPQNGIAGLKLWRYGLGTVLLVALVSLSPGIAVASGAPPITGKNDFVGTKNCGTSQAAANSIERTCLN